MLALLAAVPAGAQTPAAAPAPSTAQQSDPDVRVDPLQPDFTLAALPTTLRLPNHKLAFRVTHRFSRSFGSGDFGDLLADFFGLDSGAQIGLELRYGLRRGTQIGIHRTNDRTIQLFAQQSILQERDGRPFGLDGIVTLEGRDNLHQQRQSALGVILSKRLAGHAAVYAEPLVVFNSNPDEGDAVDENNTFMTGLGVRVRVRPSMYVTGEITPRLAGYDPKVNQMTFALETRVGGHTFQVNVGNGFGTTFGQIARGGESYDSWFLGFNISRKFF